MDTKIISENHNTLVAVFVIVAALVTLLILIPAINGTKSKNQRDIVIELFDYAESVYIKENGDGYDILLKFPGEGVKIGYNKEKVYSVSLRKEHFGEEMLQSFQFICTEEPNSPDEWKVYRSLEPSKGSQPSRGTQYSDQ